MWPTASFIGRHGRGERTVRGRPGSKWTGSGWRRGLLEAGGRGLAYSLGWRATALGKGRGLRAG